MSTSDRIDSRRRKPDRHLLDEIVARTVATAHPIRIILFGSAAREAMGPDSDLDLLVVVRDGVHRRKTAQAIYQSIGGIGIAKDVVVVTESDVREYGRNPSLAIFPPLTEGKEIYHAAGQASARDPHDWLARAKSDLVLARVPLPKGALYEDLCFHAQQAAEKALKAVYQYHGWTFRYAHDLKELVTDLQSKGLVIPPEVDDAVVLTSFAWESRYPGLSEPVSGKEYRDAVHHAEAVVAWAEREIGA